MSGLSCGAIKLVNAMIDPLPIRSAEASSLKKQVQEWIALHTPPSSQDSYCAKIKYRIFCVIERVKKIFGCSQLDRTVDKIIKAIPSTGMRLPQKTLHHAKQFLSKYLTKILDINQQKLHQPPAKIEACVERIFTKKPITEDFQLTKKDFANLPKCTEKCKRALS